MSREHIYSVSEITRALKRVIHESFQPLWIEGELSGFKHHTSGHLYFTLKDAGAQIPCAMWRMYAARMSFRPADGMKVVGFGSLDIYEPAGRYQFIVTKLQPAGIGELQQAFDALVKKLRAEGLFDEQHKRPLPEYPETIGLVTSESGAALQDMVKAAAKRWPAAQLLLMPVRVQGEGAAKDIARGIAALNRDGRPDVLIVGRGGGSLEDLWAFNEEAVARAVFHSKIPIVSAVGHEVDLTISDLTADARAATPTAAIELILPDRDAVADDLRQVRRLMRNRVLEQTRYARERLRSIRQHWAMREPVNIVRHAAQHLDELHGRLLSAAMEDRAVRHRALERLQELLTAYNPQAMLDRGYAVVYDETGRVLRDAAAVGTGDAVSIKPAKGRLTATVEKVFSD